MPSDCHAYFSVCKMERLIIKFSESRLIGALKQIGTWALGHIQKYPVVSTALKQNPSIIEENVFLCGILAEDKCSQKPMLRLTGTNPNKTQVCQAKPLQLGNRCVQSACCIAYHPEIHVPLMWLQDIPAIFRAAPLQDRGESQEGPPNLPGECSQPLLKRRHI